MTITAPLTPTIADDLALIRQQLVAIIEAADGGADHHHETRYIGEDMWPWRCGWMRSTARNALCDPNNLADRIGREVVG